MRQVQMVPWRAAAWLTLLLGLLVAASAPLRAELSAAQLPSLTGRVVDDAHVLKPEDQTALTTRLKDLEDQSGIQFVVATVPSLQGEEIEPYANALFRKWRLGQKDKNNGVLFLIAPNERKIRFEVGYGLEGTLTDALTKLILHNAVGPKLKTGDYAGGIKASVDEAIAVLTTDKSDWQKRPAFQGAQDTQVSPAAGMMILFIVLVVVILLIRYRHSINWTSVAVGSMIGNSGGSSSGGGGSSGDSFSGGGGDSGGGGSSDSY